MQNIHELKATWESRLSRYELHSGASIRVPGCTPLGKGTFLLDVRCALPLPRKNKYRLQVVRTDTNERLYCYADGEAAIDSPYVHRKTRRWVERRFRAMLLEGVYGVRVELVKVGSGRVACSFELEADYWRHDLTFEYYERIRNPFADESYETWRLEHCVSEQDCAWQRSVFDKNAPLISLVSPLYRTPAAYLRAMLDSVIAQTYENWELVLVNASPDDEGIREVLADYEDARIKLFDHPENDGINGNTNFGIAHCKGAYVGFIDHDDFIEPNLLFEYVSAIADNPQLDLLYCDEDTYREGEGYTLPLFKPELCPDLLYSNNYAIHLLMASRRALESIELAPDETNGAQDYDLTLKLLEYSGEARRIPHVLYHWRAHELSTNAGNKDVKPYANVAGQTALRNHFARRGIACDVQLTNVPYVYRSITHTGYTPDDVTLIQSDDARERNELVRGAQTPFVLLCSQGTHVPTPEQIQMLLSYFARDEVGMVAPRLVYKELLVRYGIVVAPDGTLVRLGEGLPVGDPGYVGRFVRPANYSVLDYACVLVRTKTYLELGGYSDVYETSDYAQAELCLRHRDQGLHLVLTPFVECTYKAPLLETALPCERTERTRALARDRVLFAQTREASLREGDPFFDPNLDERNPYYKLKR